uniref:Uncharacterized protein n=1 Tax=Aegilops tauschii subsp. strangulata TaxID=200361 RepID=A0A453PGX7_AEGTS
TGQNLPIRPGLRLAAPRGHTAAAAKEGSVSAVRPRKAGVRHGGPVARASARVWSQFQLLARNDEKPRAQAGAG